MASEINGGGSGGNGSAASQVQGNTASLTTDVGNPVKIGLVYNVTKPSPTNGQRVDAQADSAANLEVAEQYSAVAENNADGVDAVGYKPLATNTYAPTLYAPLTQVTTNFIKASPGNVFSAYITNDNATVRYFQLHNKATAPAGTNVPLYSFKVPAGTANAPGVLILENSFFTQAGSYFSIGIGWAISTTFATFTDSATNTEHIVVVHYK